jgi:hypothetical protein
MTMRRRWRRYHEPLAKMVFDTEIYLKQPSSQYLGRRFTVYLDFMGSPNETDARNYGADYYVIVFPAPNMQAMRRRGFEDGSDPAYVFALRLDPLAEKHFTTRSSGWSRCCSR